MNRVNEGKALNRGKALKVNAYEQEASRSSNDYNQVTEL